MSDNDFTTAFTVDQSPDEVFAAINDVRAWWSGEIDGPTDQIGGQFTYRYKDVHRSTQTITELVPGRRVVWRVDDAEINFVKDTTEWNGATVEFDIAPKGGKTGLTFTHKGLVPTIECDWRSAPSSPGPGGSTMAIAWSRPPPMGTRRAGLEITFAAVLPRFSPQTGVGRPAVEAYAARSGQSVEAYLEEVVRTGGPLVTPDGAGGALVGLVTQAPADVAPAYLLSGDGLKRLP